MNSHGRILAALSGALFLAGSLAIILGQALLTPLAWGQYQVLTVLMIVGTIAAGHLAKSAWKAGFMLSCLGFSVLFLAGSALVVYNSVGRQAEAHDTIAMERAAANSLIEDKRRDVESARERLATAEANADRERGSKCKQRCKDWEAAASDARNVIRVLESEIRALGAPKPVDAKADKAGELAAVFGYDRQKAAALAALIEPFLWTIFFEIGSIVSLGYAFNSSAAQVSNVFKVSSVSRGHSGGGIPQKQDTQIRIAEDHEIAALRCAFKASNAPLTNDELAALLKCSKSEASKRVTKAINLGIARRQRVGKTVAISLH